ncbi:MAG: cytochrome c biogenesis protein CcdA [Actinomycetota bacterium]|nr:cytochrome c biogenesis protein CcdA [Actinomycetota bacterium]
MADPSVPIAFGAGVVSFLSPCVLPLVPGYISYMSGLTAGSEELPDRVKTRRAAIASLVFVMGFTAVFVPLGATASLLGQLLRSYQDELRIASGIFIILLGLVFMNVIKLPFLQREARFHPKPGSGLGGAAVLGGAFAFGWSPCIGPILGSVLTLAAGRGATGSAAEGALLLAVYSLGLGVPFVLAGLGVTRLTGVVSWLRKHTRTVSLASGVLLMIVGLLFVTDQLFQISIWMQKAFSAAGLDFLARI